MSNKFKNKNWFICKYCGYHADEESLRDGLYITDVSKETTVVECPKCGMQQMRD